MSSNRYVQNFRQRRALLLSNDTRAADAISTMVERLGLTVERLPLNEADLRADLLAASAARDVLFLDGDLNLFTGVESNLNVDLPDIPVVGLVGIEAPSRLRTLMQFGATAFISKPVQGGSVFSALYLAVNNFEKRSVLRRTLEELELRRRCRRHVIKAVTMIMKSHSLDDEGAFALLRKESMRARLSLEAYCECVVQRSTARPISGKGPDEKQAVAE